MKLRLILLLLLSFACHTLFSQNRMLDSLLVSILDKINVIDTSTISIRNTNPFKFREKRGFALQVHYSSSEGDKYALLGYHKFYFKNGGIKSIEFLDLDGSNQGKKIEYYKNGKIKNKLDYGLNLNHDCCNYYGKWFDKYGNVEQEGQIQNGDMIGKWYYYKSGKLDYYIDFSVNPSKVYKCNDVE